MSLRAAITTLIIIAAVSAGLYSFYLLNPSAYAKFSSLQFLQQPEPFTELYFMNATALPRTLAAHQALSFTFGIHNVEGATTTYPYNIYFKDQSGKVTGIATGTVTLADNGTILIPVSYTFSFDPNGRVVVSLPSQGGEQIDFLLPNKE